MKLNNAKVMEIIRKRNNRWSTNHIRKKFRVSERRVNQILQYYKENEKAPQIGKKLGRPCLPIAKRDVKMVDEAYREYRFSASLLEPIIRRDYKQHIPHNRIHRILIMLGKARKLDKEIIRRRFIVHYNESIVFHWAIWTGTKDPTAGFGLVP